jgi:hypothetical protein
VHNKGGRIRPFVIFPQEEFKTFALPRAPVALLHRQPIRPSHDRGDQAVRRADISEEKARA